MKHDFHVLYMCAALGQPYVVLCYRCQVGQRGGATSAYEFPQLHPSLSVPSQPGTSPPPGKPLRIHEMHSIIHLKSRNPPIHL